MESLGRERVESWKGSDFPFAHWLGVAWRLTTPGMAA